MGIFDFFRKKAKEEEPKIKGKEEVTLSELGSWIEDKIKEIEEKEEKVFSLIKNKIDSLSTVTAEKIKTAEKFDISLKKEKERVKSAVEEGRKKYIEAAEDLIESMNNMKDEGLEKMISYSDKVFIDFNKKSYLSYERATILIGKEMSEIRQTLKSFSNDLINIFNENKDLIESTKTIITIRIKSKQLEKIDEEIKKAAEEITFFGIEIVNKEKENKEIHQKIEWIKRSSDHIEMLETQGKIEDLKNELEKDISNLGRSIDFKALGNFYHIFEDKMEILNGYRENFKKSFQEDGGRSIINLLEGAKLNNEKIFEKFNQIGKKREEISKLDDKKDKDKTEELNLKIKERVSDIESLKDKKVKGEKRLADFNEEREEIIKEIRENIEKFGTKLK